LQFILKRGVNELIYLGWKTQAIERDGIGPVEFLIGVGELKSAGKTLGLIGRNLPRGGLTFAEYKLARGGTETLGNILTTNAAGKPVFQRISTEFHHALISQSTQRAYDLPNWLVNNRINVWKLNTIQHSLLDKYRFNFLRNGFKSQVGWFKQSNWFTKF